MKGQALTVLDIDPTPGVRLLRDIIADPVGFRWKVMTGNLPDLRGARLGQTNTAGRVDIGLPGRIVYHWTVLGLAEEGWEAIIIDQETIGDILEFTVRLTKGTQKILRRFQIHPDFIRGKFLEIDDRLGVKLLSRLIVHPPHFDWTHEAARFPDLAGLRLGETNSQGDIVFSPFPNYTFNWSALGFHQDGWEAVITESGVRHGRYEFSVRFSKGRRSIHKTFQIGYFTRLLRGEREMKGKVKEVLEIDDKLGLRAVADLVAGRYPLKAHPPQEVSFLEGLQLGTTRAHGQIVFRPFPHYEYHWAILGSYQAGWKAVISTVRWNNGWIQLTVELTKEGQAPHYRTFQIGPLLHLLRRADEERRAAPTKKVSRLIHLKTLVGLMDSLRNGVRESSYNFRTERVEAVDPSADVSRQVESSEFMEQFDRVLETLPKQDREIAEKFLDGEGIDAIVQSNGFTRTDVLRVRRLLQTKLSRFAPDDFSEEESMAVSVAVAEAAARREGQAVVDAVGLEEFPGLVPILQHIGPGLTRKIVLFGRSDTAEDVSRQTGMQYVPERNPDAMAAALGRMAGLEEVTSLGPANLADPIKIAAGAQGLRFVQRPFSVKSFLMGLGTPEKLASDLAAGLEEVVGLGREA